MRLLSWLCRLLIIFALLYLVVWPDTGSAQQTSFGLLGYWRFDDASGTTAADSSGQGNHAAVKGRAAWTPSGRVGGALNFNAQTDYVVTPVLFSQLANGMTWEAWAKHDNPSMTWSWVFSEDSNDDAHSQMGKMPGVGETWFSLQGIGGIGGAETRGVNIADGQWHHFAGVWEKGVGLKLYIDGLLKASGTFTGSLTAKKAVRIGGKNDAYSAEKWNGAIDEARIYLRALTQAEIQADMESAAPSGGSGDSGGTPAASSQAGIRRTLVFHEFTALPRSLVDGSEEGAADPVISRDGKRAAFVVNSGDPRPERGKQSRVYVVNTDGTGLRQVDAYAPGCYCSLRVNISEDGSVVASSDSMQVRLANADGSGARSLVATDGNVGDFKLSGDGRQVFFKLNRDTVLRTGIQGAASTPLQRGIYVVGADGSGRRQIVSPAQVSALLPSTTADTVCCFDTGLRGRTLDVSRDGSRVVFAAGGVYGIRGRLFTVSGTGTGLTLLVGPKATTGDVNFGHAAVSGDGRKVAYGVSDSGSLEVGVISADGSGRRALLTIPGALAPYPSGDDRYMLSNDGSVLLLGSTGLLYNTDGSGVMQLLALGDAPIKAPVLPGGNIGMLAPTMNRDGSRFLYLAPDANEFSGQPGNINSVLQFATLDINPPDLLGAPSITDPKVDPPAIKPGGPGATVSVKVTTSLTIVGVSPLLLLNGVEARKDFAGFSGRWLRDDGTTGDVTAGDNIFTSNKVFAGGDAALGPRTVRVSAEVRASDGKRHATAIDFEPFAVSNEAVAALPPTATPVPPTRTPTPTPTPAFPTPGAATGVLVSDSFNRTATDRCALGQADLASGGTGTHFYLPIFAASSATTGVAISNGALQNNSVDYSGAQLAASPGGCSGIRGENLGQDINVKVNLYVPTDAGDHISQAGPYRRGRAAAAGDGILGGDNAGYWMQLLSTGEVKIKNLNSASILAFSGKPASFDSAAFHTLEVATLGNLTQVALDGQLLTFNQGGSLVTSLSTPATGGSNDGTVGVAFAAEDNRGAIGGQRADNLVVSAYRSLAGLPVQNNFAAPTPTPTPTPTPAPSVQTTDTTLFVEERTAAPNGTVVVPVRLDKASGLGSLNFQLRYDSSVIKVNKAEAGDLASGSLFLANTRDAGIIRFGVVSQGSSGISGTGPIAHIEFSAVGARGARSALLIEEVLATNTAGARLGLTLRAGGVSISSKLKGDYDGDGRITAKDALAALRMSVQDLAEDLNLDMNNDGRVTAEDARQILTLALESPAGAASVRGETALTFRSDEGGQLSVSGTGTILDGTNVSIPPGAFRSSTPVTLRLSLSDLPKPAHLIPIGPVDSLLVAVGPTVNIEPSVTLTLDRPITVTIPIDRSLLSEQPGSRSPSVVIASVDPSGRLSWELVSANADLSAGRVTFQLGHFSKGTAILQDGIDDLIKKLVFDVLKLPALGLANAVKLADDIDATTLSPMEKYLTNEKKDDEDLRQATLKLMEGLAGIAFPEFGAVMIGERLIIGTGAAAVEMTLGEMYQAAENQQLEALIWGARSDQLLGQIGNPFGVGAVPFWDYGSVKSNGITPENIGEKVKTLAELRVKWNAWRNHLPALDSGTRAALDKAQASLELYWQGKKIPAALIEMRSTVEREAKDMAEKLAERKAALGAAAQPAPTPAPKAELKPPALAGPLVQDKYYVELLEVSGGAFYISTPANLAKVQRCSFSGGGNCPSDVVSYRAIAGPFDTARQAQAALCANITETHVFPLGVGTKGRWQGSEFYGLWNASVSKDVCGK